MVNHATKNEMAKISVSPYLAGTVNHATKNETVKINDTIFIWHMDVLGWKEENLDTSPSQVTNHYTTNNSR